MEFDDLIMNLKKKKEEDSIVIDLENDEASENSYDSESDDESLIINEKNHHRKKSSDYSNSLYEYSRNDTREGREGREVRGSREGRGSRGSRGSREGREYRRINSSNHSDRSVVSSSSSTISSSTDSSYSDSSSNNSRSSIKKSRKRMSPEEILKCKREILYQFDRLERKGYKVPKFNMSSNLDDMKESFDKIKKDREVDVSIKFQRRGMMAIVTGFEFINSKFNPFDFKLDGWSESINDSIDDYDDIFEQLHEKYKGKSRMPPELKLLFMLGGSAFMFHLSNTMLKSSMPEIGQVMKQNPDLAKQFASATLNTMSKNNNGGGLGGLLSGFLGGGLGGGLGGIANMFGGVTNGADNNTFREQKMQGPSNVDDILKEIDEARQRESKNDRLDQMSTVSSSDIPDDATVSGIFPRNGKRTLDI